MTRKKKNGNGNGNNNGNSDGHTNTEYKLLREFKPKTRNQNDYVRAIAENDVVICTGPAGSGKTAVAVGIACEHLVFGKVNKIIITRPVVEAGSRGIGYLPGTANDKLHPYLLPILDEMSMYFTDFEIQKLMYTNTIEVAPLQFMRGRNFHRSFMILDEAQNASADELKMFVTRIGNHSKCILNGDLQQSDLNHNSQLGLQLFIEKLCDVQGISIIHLDNTDIVRNPIISIILERLQST